MSMCSANQLYMYICVNICSPAGFLIILWFTLCRILILVFFFLKVFKIMLLKKEEELESKELKETLTENWSEWFYLAGNCHPYSVVHAEPWSHTEDCPPAVSTSHHLVRSEPLVNLWRQQLYTTRTQETQEVSFPVELAQLWSHEPHQVDGKMDADGDKPALWDAFDLHSAQKKERKNQTGQWLTLSSVF